MLQTRQSIISDHINVSILPITTGTQQIFVFIQLSVFPGADDFAWNRRASGCVSPFHSSVLNKEKNLELELPTI